MEIKVVKDILAVNDRIAEENRKLFDQKGIKVFNLMSSPGSGKTTLLEQTAKLLEGKRRIGVIVGDVQGSLDAQRISASGARSMQINTGGSCHLDANMIHQALLNFDLEDLDLLFIENVGNLVCPAEFKVGEDAKVMMLSIPEGEDKPAKYPLMFRESKLLLINKIDLVPYTDCDPAKVRENALNINPSLEVLEISCKKGQGIDAWLDWLLKHMA
jgi:hydrogenase nickel incorporation protein HypB